MISESIKQVLAHCCITTMGMGTTPRHTMRGNFLLPW